MQCVSLTSCLRINSTSSPSSRAAILRRLLGNGRSPGVMVMEKTSNSSEHSPAHRVNTTQQDARHTIEGGGSTTGARGGHLLYWAERAGCRSAAGLGPPPPLPPCVSVASGRSHVQTRAGGLREVGAEWEPCCSGTTSDRELDSMIGERRRRRDRRGEKRRRGEHPRGKACGAPL